MLQMLQEAQCSQQSGGSMQRFCSHGQTRRRRRVGLPTWTQGCETTHLALWYKSLSLIYSRVRTTGVARKNENEHLPHWKTCASASCRSKSMAATASRSAALCSSKRGSHGLGTSGKSGKPPTSCKHTLAACLQSHVSAASSKQ